MAIAAGFPPSSCFAVSPPPACRRCVLQRGDVLLLGQNQHGEHDDDGGSDCQRGAAGYVQRGNVARPVFAEVVERPVRTLVCFAQGL